MEFWEAILLGILQGLTEFLPVSSSGHLVLMQNLLNIEEESILFFDVMLHVGTLISIFLVFYKDILNLFKPPFKTMGLLILATLPAAIIMLLFSKQIEGLFSGKFLWIGFLITAGVLLAAEYVGKKIKTARPLGIKVALIMGAAQAVAVVPGISRSGSTISGGIFAGASRDTVARFSFLMSIPVILGSGLVQIIDVTNWNAVPITIVISGMLAAALTGYFAIRFMLKIIKNCNYKWFALYLFCLAVVSFIIESFI